MKKFMYLISLTIAFVILFSLSACKDDTYKNYTVSDIEVKAISVYEEITFDNAHSFACDKKAILYTKYNDFSKLQDIGLDYTESYFKNNDLLVFMIACCSSDNMEFDKILVNEGKLYPLFICDEIKEDNPITSDIIILAYRAELAKTENYELGEIIYRYR